MTREEVPITFPDRGHGHGPECMARGPERAGLPGYICTLPFGHGGRHAAHGSTGETLFKWESANGPDRSSSTPPSPHVHKCERGSDDGGHYCASRGYCECQCGARLYTGNRSWHEGTPTQIYDGGNVPSEPPPPSTESHASEAATFISEPNRSETMSNTTCPCGNPIILEGIVVKAHWEGKVCQDCESEMFKKHEARFQRALGSPPPASPETPAELKSLLDALNPWLLHDTGCGAEAGDESKCDCGINPALSAISALYDRQREEIKEMRQDAECTGGLLVGYHARATSAESSLERLTAEQLTAEEAGIILRQFGEEWYAITSVGQSMHSKLRRLSQSDTAR